MERGKASGGQGARVLLVGVPNCGKSAVFCRLTGKQARVGNWSGVTVERKEGKLRARRSVTVVDLPGICGAVPVSDEERVTARVLSDGNYDAVVQVLDAAAPERSLRLTRALAAYGKPLLLAVNRVDIPEREGQVFDPAPLGAALGIPALALSARRGTGIDALTQRLLRVLDGAENAVCHRAAPWERGAAWIRACMRDRPVTGGRKKKEGGIGADKYLCASPCAWLILFAALAALLTLTSAAFKVCGVLLGGLGEVCGGAVEAALRAWGANAFVSGFLARGVLGGVFSALSFLPPLFLYYLMTACLDDCGYMARIAFLCDRPLAAFGLGGQAVLPFLLSAGCGVTGVCACRTLTKEERQGCGGFCTWVPCHAKLPLIACVCGACGFSALGTFLFFFVTTGAALLMAGIFSRSRGAFCMELPRLCLPSARVVLRSAGFQAIGFVRRAGTLIALSGAGVWLLSNIGVVPGGLGSAAAQDSLLAWVGRRLYPLFAPLGFAGWECVTASLSGLLAKENTVVTLELLGGLGALGGRASATAFCLYNLFCPPCVAAMAAMRRELGRRAWGYFLIQLLFAAFAAAAGYHLMRACGG